MRRHFSIAGSLVALLLLWVPDCAAAARYAGTWKVIFAPGANEMTWFIINVEDKDSGPTVKLVATHADYKKFELQAGQFSGGALRITAIGPGGPYKFTAYPPKGGENEPPRMLGSVSFSGVRSFVRLERTEDKTIDSTQRYTSAAGEPELTRAVRLKDANEEAAALNEVIEKHPDSPVAYAAAMELANLLETTGATEDQIRESTEKAIEIAAEYGPEMRADAVAKTVRMLLGSKKTPALAVFYAREMLKGLAADAPSVEQIAVLKTLRSALMQAGKTDELKEVRQRLEKLETALDDDYLKTAVPFNVEALARKGTAGRVVLVELFTNADCFPCVGADVAFDAALQSYRPGEVILLQYHTNIPDFDPLTNADADKRAAYYSLESVPSTYVAGGANLRLGGPKDAGKDRYSRLAKAIDLKLDEKSAAQLELKVKQTGKGIIITASIADLKYPGADTKLRLALVEEAVRYPGSNRQRIHHHVVRAMPGGPDGFTLDEATATHEVKINLAELKKSLDRGEDFPLDLQRLIAVAFIQNDKTREVLQSAQADVLAGTTRE